MHIFTSWNRRFAERQKEKAAFLAVLSLIGVLALVCPAAAKAKQDISVEPTHYGKVMGRIYDAETGTPIQGAVVVVQQDGTFAAEGRTVGKTDALGAYNCEAILGRVSSNIDVGRLLSSSVIGLLSGSASKVTKRVDVTRLNLRASCDGYHGFEGIVPCRSIDTGKFSVAMEPILLTKADSSEVSTVAEGWGVARVLSVNVEPCILKPRSSAVVTVRVKCPRAPKSESFAVECASQVLGKKKLDLTPGTEATELIFSKKLETSRKGTAEVISALLQSCPYDIAAGGDFAETLVQVVTTPAEETAAQLRLGAYRLRVEGKSTEALASLQQLCALPEATAGDFENTARLADRVHDVPAAADAWQRAVEKSDEKERFSRMAGYADALVANGQADRVIAEIAPVIEGIKEKDRPKKVPAALMASVGMAYIQVDKLAEADAVNAALTKYPNESLSAASGFRRGLRLAHAEAAIKSDPNSAKACGDYGRVLMDLGRWEESVGQLNKSISLDPNVPAVRWDLGYALVHVRGDNAQVGKSFDDALADAEKAVQGETEKQKSKDFTTWHTLGMLRYRKACVQQKAGDSAAQQSLGRARESLVEALRCGRSGRDVLSGGAYYNYFGYFGSKIVGISGFAYPEANSDFVVMECLKTLDTHPEDYLAYLNLAVALVDLQQADLADEALTKCVALKPDVPEVSYVRALIAMQGGDDSEATTRLNEVVKLNPRHPNANLMLAKLHTQAGDMAAASSCLAAHATYYGSTQ